MDQLLQNFKKWLLENKWEYTVYPDPQRELPEEIKQYKGQLPQDYRGFLAVFQACNAHSETAWFLTYQDFITDSEMADFTYNSFKAISLEYASEPQEIMEIQNFWNRYLVIFMAVNGYEYYALDTETAEIVHGYEPIFEEVTVVAKSFTEFLEKVMIGEIRI